MEDTKPPTSSTSDSPQWPTQLAAAIRTLGEHAEAASGETPSDEELIAYRAGDLNAADRRRIEDQLASNRGASARLLELIRLETAEPMPVAQVDAAWQRFLERRQTRQSDPAPAGATAPAATPGRPAWTLVLAASFFLCALLASFWARSLHQQLDHARQPQINLEIFDLNPAVETLRDPENPEPLTLRPTAERYVVLLYPSPSPSNPFGDYSCALLDNEGKVLWHGLGLQPTKFGNFAIEIPRRLTPPGRYYLELRGVNEDASVELENFAFHILPE